MGAPTAPAITGRPARSIAIASARSSGKSPPNRVVASGVPPVVKRATNESVQLSLYRGSTHWRSCAPDVVSKNSSSVAPDTYTCPASSTATPAGVYREVRPTYRVHSTVPPGANFTTNARCPPETVWGFPPAGKSSEFVRPTT